MITPAEDVANVLFGHAYIDAVLGARGIVEALDPYGDANYDDPADDPSPFTTFQVVTVDGTTVRVTCEAVA
jgi:hypothetical protein